jgi:zinc protease
METSMIGFNDARAFAARLAAPAAIAGLVAVATSSGASSAPIERVVSPGGIEAWLVTERSVPLIALNFAFVGGSTQDPAGKEGLANMLSSLLDEGAGDLDAQAFQRRLEETSVKLSFSASRDNFTGEMRTLTKNRADGFELLRLALSAPRFDQEPVERVRAQIEARLRSERSDPETIASREWFLLAFPDHPYGRPPQGTLETVARITSADLKDLAGRLFARDNLKVAVVGDIDAATLAQLLDQVFGSLPARADLVAVPETEPKNLGALRVFELNVPQSVIQFGGQGLKRKDEDFIPAFVLNHILGGGSFSSRLYTEVREKRGLAYSVYSYLAPLDRAGLFLGGTATQNARAAESLSIIQDEIRRLAVEGPTADELEKAKRFLIGSYPLRFDTSAKIAGQLVQIQLDELGIGYIDRRNSLIEAVTAEDIRRVADRMLTADLLVTVVGKPDGIAARPKRT